MPLSLIMSSSPSLSENHQNLHQLQDVLDPIFQIIHIDISFLFLIGIFQLQHQRDNQKHLHKDLILPSYTC